MAPTSYRDSCTNNSYQRFPSHTRATLLPLPTLMTQPRAITGRRDSIAKLTRSLFNSKTNSPRSYSALNLYKRNASFLNQIGGTPSSLHSSENVIEDSSHSGSSNSPNIEEREGEDEPDLTLGIKDPKVLQTVAKHLNNSHEDGLAAEGADITRALYKLSNDSRPGLKRSKSDLLLEPGSRRGSTASHLRVPGGFRRHFILAKNKRTPSLITRNFVEFLSIYGHFAGEDLEDEEDLACHYEPYLPYGEDTPLLPSDVNPNGTASDTKAYFLLLKAFVGTGVLFLPKAFSSGGLLFSAVVLFLFGLLSFWCYYILVQSKVATKVSGFAEIGLKTYGVTLQRLILFSIIISQIGFVAAYIVFTAENLRAFLVNISSYQTRDLDIFWFILFQAVILTPLSMIRDITRLSLLALLANIFIFAGLVTILYYTIRQYFQNHLIPGQGIHFFFNKSESSLFIGVAIFAFEGIGLIIPIQESMIYPSHFPKVLLSVILTISSIFVFVGSIGYLTYGKKIHTVILLNLPQESPTVIMTQVLYACAILLSTPIQIFPAVRLIELKFFLPHKSGRYSARVKWQKNLLRCLFVLTTATIALYGGKNLDKFVSFVGCFACIPLVYMYPPMLHLKTCCQTDCEDCFTKPDPDASKKRWLARLDYFLILLGALAVVYTTYDILAH